MLNPVSIPRIDPTWSWDIIFFIWIHSASISLKVYPEEYKTRKAGATSVLLTAGFLVPAAALGTAGTQWAPTNEWKNESAKRRLSTASKELTLKIVTIPLSQCLSADPCKPQGQGDYETPELRRKPFPRWGELRSLSPSPEYLTWGPDSRGRGLWGLGAFLPHAVPPTLGKHGKVSGWWHVL